MRLCIYSALLACARPKAVAHQCMVHNCLSSAGALLGMQPTPSGQCGLSDHPYTQRSAVAHVHLSLPQDCTRGPCP